MVVFKNSPYKLVLSYDRNITEIPQAYAETGSFDDVNANTLL